MPHSHSKGDITQSNNKDGSAKKSLSIYHGPYPDPDSLNKYEQIYPGFTERVLNMAEEEQKHRHLMENTIVANENVQVLKHSKVRIIGARWAFASVLIIALVCFYGFYQGFAEQTASIAKTVFIGLAAVFLIRTGFNTANKALTRNKSQEINIAKIP